MSGPPRGSRQALRQGRPATTTATAVSFNGHYDQCLFMFSILAASEIWPEFGAFNSLASFA
jgi:hypothetical protein